MYTFIIGDEVRILHLRHQFQRDYDQTFTEEIFIVSDRVVSQDIPIYKLKDMMSEPIQCIFFMPANFKSYPNENRKSHQETESLWKTGSTSTMVRQILTFYGGMDCGDDGILQ